MKKVILNVAVTLDGLIEGPNGEYDWCFNDQDYGLTEFFNSVDTIFMGRKSYEVALANGGIDMMKGPSIYVFSNTISPGNVKVIRTLKDVESILQQDGKDAWLYGGSQLVAAFMNADLVDELWLSYHPIVLGRGKQLFTDIDRKKNYKLIGSTSYSSGLITLKYSKQ